MPVFEASFDQLMIIAGDYGRVEGKKVFMGVAQIMIDDLDLSNIVIGKTHVHKLNVNQGSFSRQVGTNSSGQALW